jgi:hypothetical protein
VLASWEEVYDSTYSGEEDEGEAGFDTAGWTSSYDGSAIPPAAMREWLEGTLTRVGTLRGRAVLEVGVGTGMLLQGVCSPPP